jgi:hypothetical protein
MESGELSVKIMPAQIAAARSFELAGAPPFEPLLDPSEPF